MSVNHIQSSRQHGAGPHDRPPSPGQHNPYHSQQQAQQQQQQQQHQQQQGQQHAQAYPSSAHASHHYGGNYSYQSAEQPHHSSTSSPYTQHAYDQHASHPHANPSHHPAYAYPHDDPHNPTADPSAHMYSGGQEHADPSSASPAVLRASADPKGATLPYQQHGMFSNPTSAAQSAGGQPSGAGSPSGYPHPYQHNAYAGYPPMYYPSGPGLGPGIPSGYYAGMPYGYPPTAMPGYPYHAYHQAFMNPNAAPAAEAQAAPARSHKRKSSTGASAAAAATATGQNAYYNTPGMPPPEAAPARGKKKEKKEEKKKSPEPPPAPLKPHLKPPKKSPSAWQLYFAEDLKRIKTENPGIRINVADHAKEAAERYSALDDSIKQKYNDEAAAQKVGYLEAMEVWRAKLTPSDISLENAYRTAQRKAGKSRKANVRDPNAPPKPLSAYFLFLRSVRADPSFALRVWGEEKGTTKQSVEAAKKWREMSDEEKRPYVSDSEKHKEAYDQARREYEESRGLTKDGEPVPGASGSTGRIRKRARSGNSAKSASGSATASAHVAPTDDEDDDEAAHAAAAAALNADLPSSAGGTSLDDVLTPGAQNPLHAISPM